MPTVYHATSYDNACSIQENGFEKGKGGKAGPGMYFADCPEDAMRRSKGGKDVDFCSEDCVCSTLIGIAANATKTQVIFAVDVEDWGLKGCKGGKGNHVCYDKGAINDFRWKGKGKGYDSDDDYCKGKGKKKGCDSDDDYCKGKGKKGYDSDDDYCKGKKGYYGKGKKRPSPY